MIARYVRVLLVPLFFLLTGAVLGYALRGLRPQAEIPKKAVVEQREGSQRLINPLLACDTDSSIIQSRELTPFVQDVKEFIAKRMDQRSAKSVSVYFRELNDGLWFSVGDQETFTIASLRKVPMMIALLKQAEVNRALLSRKIPFRLQRDYNAAQAIKPSHVMTPGQEYAVEELLFRMIVYSDNNAFTLLAAVVDPGELDRVYSIFNISPPGLGSDKGYQSADSYASFFKILYNASYLGREFSEKALELLAMSEFRAGIVSGVPPGTYVAHKFGEHWDPGSAVKELHDCGIVYYPAHPYLLCIMSRGDNFELLDDAIASISRLIYTRVDGQHAGHAPLTAK